jgi:hypothetical protein
LSLEREYQRLGMTHEMIRARRDRAITLIYLSLPAEGEAELVRAYEVPRQSGEDQFLTLMWLAETALGRQDVPQARHWLAVMRLVTRRHPEEAPRLLRFQFVAQHVAALQHAVADLAPRQNR